MFKLVLLLLTAIVLKGGGFRIPVASRSWAQNLKPGYRVLADVTRPNPASQAIQTNQAQRNLVGTFALNNARLAIASSGGQSQSLNGEDVQGHLQTNVEPLTDFKLNEVQDADTESHLDPEMQTSNDPDMKLDDLQLEQLSTGTPLLLDQITTVNYRKRYREKKDFEKSANQDPTSTNDFQDWELGRTYSSNTGTTFGRGASGSSTTTIIRELQGSADPHFVGVVRLRGAREENPSDLPTTMKPFIQNEWFHSKRFKEFAGESNQQSFTTMLQANNNLDTKAWELGRTYSRNTGTTSGRGTSVSSTTTITRESQVSADPHFVGVLRLRGAGEGESNQQSFTTMLQANNNLDTKAWELGRTYSSNTGTTSGRGVSGSSTTTITRESQGSADPHFVGVLRLIGGDDSPPPPDRNPATASPHEDYMPATQRTLVPDNFPVGENIFLQFAQNNPNYFSNPGVLNVPENTVLVNDPNLEYLQYGEYAEMMPHDNNQMAHDDGVMAHDDDQMSIDSDLSLSRIGYQTDDESIADSNTYSIADRPTSYVVATYTREGVQQGLYNGQHTGDISRILTDEFVASDSRNINNNDRLFDAGHIIANTLGGPAEVLGNTNLFPQHRRVNRGVWRDFEQQVLRMRNNPNHATTVYEVRLEYEQPGHTIPSHITGMARSFDANNNVVQFVTARMPNPVNANARLERIENVPQLPNGNIIEYRVVMDEVTDDHAMDID